MAVHCFDPGIATFIGVEPALILQNLNFWIEKNKANEKHFYDGAYWTYNSVDAFSALFPYMSDSTIRRSLKILKDAGIINSGNYNKVKFDRTLWYSITEYGYAVIKDPFANLSSLHLVKTENGDGQNDEPIPYSSTDSKPVIKQDIYASEKENEKETGENQDASQLNGVSLFPDEQLESKNPIKDKKKEKHTASPIFRQIINTYLSNYDILYSRGAVLTGKPIVRWAKECKNLKNAIKSFGEDVVLKAMEQSINNEYCVKSGYSFALIINPTVMNSILNGKSKASPTVAARRTEICEIPEA